MGKVHRDIRGRCPGAEELAAADTDTGTPSAAEAGTLRRRSDRLAAGRGTTAAAAEGSGGGGAGGDTRICARGRVLLVRRAHWRDSRPCLVRPLHRRFLLLARPRPRHRPLCRLSPCPCPFSKQPSGTTLRSATSRVGETCPSFPRRLPRSTFPLIWSRSGLAARVP